jgi:hypothetical protein
VIKLGHHASEWLVIHSKVFAAVSSRSPLFPVVWGMDPEEAADTITHPNMGKCVAVRVLALKAVGDGFMLDGKNVVLETGDYITVPYHKSALAGEGWSVSGEARSYASSPALCAFSSLWPTAPNSAGPRSPATSTQLASWPKYAHTRRPGDASKPSDPPSRKR